MLKSLKIQFKVLSKDKMVWVSVLFPIILAICIRLFAGNIVIEHSIGYVENELSSEQITVLNRFVDLKAFENQSDLESYVLDSSSDVIGVLFDNETHDYEFLLQGNELSIDRENLVPLYNYLKDSSFFDEIHLKAIVKDEDFAMTLLITLTILMGLFLGSVFNAFNIVAEKEDRIDVINEILPMSIKTYIIQKSVIGFIASFLLSLITLLIVTGIEIPIIPTVILLLMGSLLSSLVGLYLGYYSNEQMIAIIITKVVLLIFTFVPFIGFMVPQELEWVKRAFYIIPSYAVFNGLWALVEGQDIGIILINSLIILLYSALGIWIYILINKGNRTLKSL